MIVSHPSNLARLIDLRRAHIINGTRDKKCPETGHRQNARLDIERYCFRGRYESVALRNNERSL
jgi:hypothetical protein